MDLRAIRDGIYLNHSLIFRIYLSFPFLCIQYPVSIVIMKQAPKKLEKRIWPENATASSDWSSRGRVASPDSRGPISGGLPYRSWSCRVAKEHSSQVFTPATFLFAGPKLAEVKRYMVSSFTRCRMIKYFNIF